MSIKQARQLQTIAITLLASTVFAGLATSKQIDSVDGSKAKPALNNPLFHKDLLAVAAQYKDYGKVDDMARFAPSSCAFLPGPKARLSASKDKSTHGLKVYFLFAKQRDDYLKKLPPKVGQVVVKESWIPVDQTSKTPTPSDKQGGLFIMMKVDPKVPGTDNGWVYGTVTPDGKTVATSGRVQSCMECHASAANDRLFGLTP